MSTTPHTAAPMFGCRDLHKSFGRTAVLRGLTLGVHPGRVYALLGPNGAGKSTALKIMLGLLRADAGTAYLLGEPFHRRALAHVGASIDGPALYGHLSARGNLMVHAHLIGADAAAVARTLETVGLDRAGRKHAGRFSTGMKARLALAIALLGDPRILVLDEPQNGLDPQGIRELRELIRRLAAAGTTVLVSSHQLGEVTHLADDIGVLTRGRLAYEGPLAAFAPPGQLEEAYFRATTEPAAPGAEGAA